MTAVKLSVSAPSVRKPPLAIGCSGFSTCDESGVSSALLPSKVKSNDQCGPATTDWERP